MNVVPKRLHIQTDHEGEMHDLTEDVEQALEKTGLKEGTVTIFCTGSTYAISTIEYEPGLCRDFPSCMEQIAPKEKIYAHHQTWHDDNGRSHIKATLMGPSLTIPFIEGELTLGTWQQIVLFEWDTRPRAREVVLQFMGK